jgi:hypothetical protein
MLSIDIILMKKNEIAEIETDKKIKKEIGDEFFEI